MDRDEPTTSPDGETVEADRAGADAPHEPDRMPTPDEERIADELELDPEVAQAHEEANERGAAVKGEGEIAP